MEMNQIVFVNVLTINFEAKILIVTFLTTYRGKVDIFYMKLLCEFDTRFYVLSFTIMSNRFVS